MNSKMRTLDDIENDYQAKWAELTGLEAKLLELHEKEWELRMELQHLQIQKERLMKISGEVPEQAPAV